jgi:hypothetical protein
LLRHLFEIREGVCKKLGKTHKNPLELKPELNEMTEDFNNFDCRLRNLEAEEVGRHRGKGRDGWSRK